MHARFRLDNEASEELLDMMHTWAQSLTKAHYRLEMSYQRLDTALTAVAKRLPTATMEAMLQQPGGAMLHDAACSICLEEAADSGEQLLMLPCKHLFHAECLQTRLHSHDSCPICRGTVAAENAE